MKIHSPLGLATLSALTLNLLPVPAGAADFETLLNSFLGRGRIDNQTQSVIQTNINTRQGQLEQEIAAGVASGQLTLDEEQDLRAQLEGVARLQGQYLSVNGQLNNIQTQTLINQLTAITTKLQAYLTNATTVGTATPSHHDWFKRYGSRDGYEYNCQAEGHIDSYQTEIEASIQQALTNGKISISAAQSLRADLNKTDADQARLSADGRLGRSDREQLMASLDAVKTRLNQEIANGERWSGSRRGRGHHYGWSRNNNPATTVYGQSMLRQRIYDGLRAGKLSNVEADRLLQKEQRIQALEAQMKVSGRRLSWNEERRLLNERDQLSMAINDELTDHDTW